VGFWPGRRRLPIHSEAAKTRGSRWWRRLAVAGLLLLAGGALAGQTPACAQEQISVAYQPIVNGPLWIARHEGYFDKIGLQVNFIKFTSGPAQFAALQGGRVNLAWGGIGPFMLARANGANIVWIATVQNYNPLEELVVPKASPITKVSQLRGKKVGLVVGSDADFGMQHALKQAAMQPSDLTILNMQPPAQVAALLNGDIDAAFTWSPFLNQILDRGGQSIFSNGSLPVGPAFLGWAGQKEWLDAHKTALSKLFRGWDMGYEKMLQSPELAAKYSVEYAGMTLDQANAMQSRLRYFPAASMLDPKSQVYFNPGSGLYGLLTEWMAFGELRKLVKGKTSPDEYVDLDYLKAFAKKGQ
jgi:ABC-type nitrate/sulfonate/bicarbonate transport system substrate-binding protein